MSGDRSCENTIMKILIVEDSATLRASTKRLVSDLGHTPLFAQSGEEALQMLGNTDFDLVIMDVEMPGLDGFETTSLMREALGDRWIPIIYSTGHDSDAKVLAGIEAGGDDYLIKPISKNLLKAKLTSMQRIAAMHQQLTKLNIELAELSQFDGLTLLLNRRAFVEKAEQCLHDVRRFTKPCAVLMMDVDFFKQYNDHYGHLSGDECLKAIAQALNHSINRGSDLVGRYGGEEFIILLPDTDIDGAIIVAERILKNIDELAIPHQLSTVADHVTMSIGVEAVSADNMCSLDVLLAGADKNLYLAKERGRHQVCSRNVSHKTLLILDKSEEQLAALTTLLQPLGIIITTDTTDECLELAKDISPNIIIVGATMEKANTHAGNFNEVLASHVRTSRIPLFYLENEELDTIVDQVNALLQ